MASRLDEAASLRPQNLEDSQQNEEVHRDGEDEHAVPLDPDPVVLDRDRGKDEEERVVVSAAERENADVLLERPVAHEGEEDDGHPVLQSHRQQERAGDPPPGPDPVAQLGEVALGVPGPKHRGDDRGQDEDADDDGSDLSHRSQS